MRAFLATAGAVALLALPAPAGGFTGDPLPDSSLSDLVDAVESKIARITSVAPLTDDALEDRRSGRISGVDLFIGEIRIEATNRVAALFPEVDRSVLEKLGSGPVTELVQAGPVGSVASRWRAETVALEWHRLDQALDELRELVTDTAPARVCPVPGGASVEDDWEDARPWGRVHKGNDLHAEFGSPLAAIEAGTVLQADWHWSGGRQLYFTADSTGDVYYYAHLEAWSEWIWTGTRVEAGDVIGLLGASGNASSPHLHLGWMPGSYTMDLDNLQNPYPLLLEICR